MPMRKLLGRAISLLSLCVFVLAIVVIRRELMHTSLADIGYAVIMTPPIVIAAAMLLTFLNYFILSGYDVLALRYLRKKLPYPTVALTSFVCHTFSNNLGISVLTGGSVRYRLYHRKGLSGPEVIQFVSFCLLTFWLGFLSLAGIVFVLLPPPMPPQLGLPSHIVQPLGLLFLLAIVWYFFLSSWRRTPISIRGCQLSVPSARLTSAQILIASCEWLIGTMILYLLLPGQPLSYLHLLGLFLVAHLAGLASQVPGGLGVFEGVVLGLLPPGIPLHAAAASLLIYRCIHNLLPLTLASAIFAIRELFTLHPLKTQPTPLPEIAR